MLSMKNSKRKSKKRNPFATVMAVCWSVILIILAVNIYVFVNTDTHYYYSADSVLERLAREDYADVYDTMSDNYRSGLDTDKHTEYTELCAVADYIGAAGQYKMYADNGMTDYAGYYKEKMENALKGFGGLSFAEQEINENLKIN